MLAEEEEEPKLGSERIMTELAFSRMDLRLELLKSLLLLSLLYNSSSSTTDQTSRLEYVLLIVEFRLQSMAKFLAVRFRGSTKKRSRVKTNCK